MAKKKVNPGLQVGLFARPLSRANKSKTKGERVKVLGYSRRASVAGHSRRWPKGKRK
jgi:hypothetical protein